MGHFHSVQVRSRAKLKHISQRREKKSTEIPPVGATEKGSRSEYKVIDLTQLLSPTLNPTCSVVQNAKVARQLIPTRRLSRLLIAISNNQTRTESPYTRSRPRKFK